MTDWSRWLIGYTILDTEFIIILFYLMLIFITTDTRILAAL